MPTAGIDFTPGTARTRCPEKPGVDAADSRRHILYVRDRKTMAAFDLVMH
jgi:hypothetical protein